MEEKTTSENHLRRTKKLSSAQALIYYDADISRFGSLFSFRPNGQQKQLVESP